LKQLRFGLPLEETDMPARIPDERMDDLPYSYSKKCELAKAKRSFL
jgi:hypothetical protein